jgi:hypothetical protein
MHDRADTDSGEGVHDWRGPQPLVCEKHLKAPLIVLGQNLAQADKPALERRYWLSPQTMSPAKSAEPQRRRSAGPADA